MRQHLFRVSPYILLVGLWGIAILGRFWANGISFGLDYGVYQPDGSHYAYRTLVFLGENSSDAANQVVLWYQNHGFKHNIFPPSFLTPENADSWGIVSPRILYSIFSIPFVGLLGIQGMLVIPALSFLILLWVSFVLGKHFVSVGFGLILAFSLSISPTILRWMISNLTDSLLCALFGIAALALVKITQGGRNHLTLILIVVLTSLTRFCIPIWVAIGLVLIFNARRKFGALVILTALIAFIPTLIAAPSNSLSPSSGDVGLLEKMADIGFSSIKVGFFEIAQLAVLDRGLLAILLAALILSLANFRDLASKYFLAIALAVWTIGAINGTIGVNFRYQLPLVPFAIWVISVGVGKFRSRFMGNALHVVGSETQNQLYPGK